jgi:hypothetical protein
MLDEDHDLFERPYLKKDSTGHGCNPLCGVYTPKHLGISHELVKPHIVGCFLLTK